MQIPLLHNTVVYNNVEEKQFHASNGDSRFRNNYVRQSFNINTVKSLSEQFLLMVFQIFHFLT